MDNKHLAQIIARISTTIKEELANIRKIKEEIVKANEFELAAGIRDLEKKLLEFQKLIDPRA